MNKRALHRGTIVTLVIAAAVLMLLSGELSRDRTMSEVIKELQLPQRLIHRELGSYLSRSDTVTLSAAMALRQLPLLEASALSAETGSDTSEARQTSENTETLNTASTPLQFADNGVPSQTVIPTNPAGYTVVKGVYIKNASNKTLETDRLIGEFAAKLSENAPQVLILHTHGSEAYSPSGGINYHSTGNYRTDEEAYSVIRVGDEIAATLSSYGISVLHDRERYDDPLYDGAYERSDAAIQTYLEKYPSITFILDIHRDAVQDGSGQQYKLVAEEDETLAQLSFIMGSNHEGWEENLKLAIAVSARVTAEHPTAMRPITLRNANYNQNYTLGSMLVEVGTAGNSLEEAIHAAQVFAKAFAETLLENSTEN